MATATTEVKTAKANEWYATGSRKTAQARVWIRPGTGVIEVNGRPLEEYFDRPTAKLIIEQAFEVTEMRGRIDAEVTVKGGGGSGQAGAVRHGLSRALTLYDSALRGPLKKAGFMTRDARKKERKKYGQKGARKRFQFSKR
ncbi:MAG: 30S ribosomal protein S9 [Deltaproteobacteria bacterium]|nr:30S ribosomal protein S9 [Deltaproteobacteria bacterium]